MSVLICDNISKKLNRKEKIKNFNYNFLDKQVYAIIGRSDSGKDLLLNLITSKVKPSDGNIFLDGEILFNNRKMSERICYIPKGTAFPSNIRVKNIFKLMSLYYAKWDNFLANKLITHFQISLDERFGKIPENKRDIFLGIISLSTRANITVFDDPVSNTDVKERYDFFNFLYEHQQIYPRTIIIATDFIDEIDYLVNEILFFEKGKLIAQFNIQEIKNDFRYLSGKTEVLKSLIGGIKVIGYEERGNELTICIRKRLTKDDVRKYQKYLIKVSEVSIQKIFIYLINLREKKGID